MKIAAVSDLHGFLPAVPPCDLLLLAGDLCPVRHGPAMEPWVRSRPPWELPCLSVHDPRYQAAWLDTVFRAWMERVPSAKIIGIAGNHDFVFEKEPGSVPPLPWTYLQDSGCEVGGLRVYGTPWQPVFMGWAFNADEERRRRQCALIPDGTDVLVCHGPPYGYGDECPSMDSPPVTASVGCKLLAERVAAVRPKLCVFGHVHEGRGEWHADGTRLANVTLVDAAYRPVHAVWTCELC